MKTLKRNIQESLTDNSFRRISELEIEVLKGKSTDVITILLSPYSPSTLRVSGSLVITSSDGSQDLGTSINLTIKQSQRVYVKGVEGKIFVSNIGVHNYFAIETGMSRCALDLDSFQFFGRTPVEDGGWGNIGYVSFNLINKGSLDGLYFTKSINSLTFQKNKVIKGSIDSLLKNTPSIGTINISESSVGLNLESLKYKNGINAGNLYSTGTHGEIKYAIHNNNNQINTPSVNRIRIYGSIDDMVSYAISQGKTSGTFDFYPNIIEYPRITCSKTISDSANRVVWQSDGSFTLTSR